MRRAERRRPYQNPRAFALVNVLLVVTLLLVLGAFVNGAIRTELRIANNDLVAKKAFELAEAGLNHSYRLLSPRDDVFTPELDHDGTGGLLDGPNDPMGSRVMARSAITGRDESFRFIAVEGGGPADGYYVRLLDDRDEPNGSNDDDTDVNGIAVIESTGVWSGASATLRSVLSIDPMPRCAITICGTVTLQGNFKALGEHGCAHSNNDMYILGSSATFDVPPTCSGDEGVKPDNQPTVGMDINANPTIEGAPLSNAERDPFAEEHEARARVPIPRVVPLDFGYTPPGTGHNLANEVRAVSNDDAYLLAADCKAYKASATWSCSMPPGLTGRYCSPSGPLHVNCPSNGQSCNPQKLPGWSCIGNGNLTDGTQPAARWTASGSPRDGAYFVEGAVEVQTVGSQFVPWRATIVAMNSINHTANATILPFVTADGSSLRSMLLISGNDIKLRGRFGSSTYPVGILAHQQIDFGGNPTLDAFVVAEHAGEAYSGCHERLEEQTPGDPAPQPNSPANLAGASLLELSIISEITGNFTINYDGEIDTPLVPRSVRRAGWSQTLNY